MEAITPNELTYPDGLNESTIEQLLQDTLDGINRDHLFEEERLLRVRHPLLEQRIGRDVALNTELYNMVMDIVTALSSPHQDGDIQHVESMLLDSCKADEDLPGKLNALKKAMTQLAESNSGDDGSSIQSLFAKLLRRKLSMPNTAQELILYPPVTVSSLGESNEEALRTLEGCRTHILEALRDKSDEGSEVIKKAVEDEAAAVREWFEGVAA